MAITALKSGKIKKIKKAARIYSVPESTLCDRLAGIKPRSEIHANGHKLSKIEEETLVKKLLDTDKHGFSI